VVYDIVLPTLMAKNSMGMKNGDFLLDNPQSLWYMNSDLWMVYPDETFTLGPSQAFPRTPHGSSRLSPGVPVVSP
jgi:hypothetical protein